MKKGYFSLANYAKAIREQINQGNLEHALVDVALRAESIKNEPLAYARIFGSRTLDILCAELGVAVFRGVGPERGDSLSGNHVIYVCTEALSSGGHARVIADLMRASAGGAHHVVFTNLWERPELFTREFESLGADITILPKASMLEKLRQLTEFLNGFQHARVFLLNHHQDAVAVAAVAGNSRHERFFIHHCDYLFCLGLFLPGVVHVDLHTAEFYNCRNALGIANNIYWPLTCDDGDTIHSGDFLAGGQLVTCCCASANKFTGRYPIDYFDAIAELLKATSGKHIHIGPIDEQNKQRLFARLASLGVARDRFQHIPYVPQLRAALLELKVDVYLVSFPLWGARAMIEAMSAGVPVIGHTHHYNKLLDGTDLTPEISPTWTEVPELIAILQALDQKTLRELSAASRARFEAFHHPRLLAQALTGEPLSAPPPRVSDIEPLQTFLFETYCITPPPQPSQAAPRTTWRHLV